MLALLYDIHGNLPALEAVLADADGADELLLGGDYATAGAWPRETVERLRELDNAGVVTFHKLAPRLTRVELSLDVNPHGPIEKIGRGMRFTKRAVRADLHRFKAYAEMNEA